MSAVSRTRTLAASLLLGITALTGCALSQTEPAAATVIEEDDPRWDCLTHGNRICGAVMADQTVQADAWETWDRQQGWTQLRLDPAREFRVDFTAYSAVGLDSEPGSVVLADSDGMRYRFTVVYL